MEQKDAVNIRKVLCKSFIQWFWELNLCCNGYISTESTVLIRSRYSTFAIEVKVKKYNKTLNVRSLGEQLVLFSLESWDLTLSVYCDNDAWKKKTLQRPSDGDGEKNDQSRISLQK